MEKKDELKYRRDGQWKKRSYVIKSMTKLKSMFEKKIKELKEEVEQYSVSQER